MENLTGFILMAHSGWRWIVLILIILTAAKMLIGWLTKQQWKDIDSKLLLFSRIAVYIQVVLGVILYILLAQWTNMRFTGEHVVVALLGVGGIEFGAARAKKAANDVAKFKLAFIGFIIALVLISAAILSATMS